MIDDCVNQVLNRLLLEESKRRVSLEEGGDETPRTTIGQVEKWSQL
jgi:hypothetical protein